MIKNEKSCPSAATLEQQAMEGFDAAPLTVINYNTPGKGIASFLSRGSQNAISLKHLEALTGEDGRSVRLAIQRERLKGIPILSNNQNGYFLPANEQEREQFVKSMKGRSKEIERVADAIANVKL